MKQSSTEPPKKKLKQARLPFQILSSPVVKNSEESQQQKRKTCETSTDDEVVVSEINENKIVPVEKKAKVIKEDDEKDKKQNNDLCMEVEEVKEEKKVQAVKQNRKKSKNTSKKISRTSSSRKSNELNTSKISEKGMSERTSSNLKPNAVDIVDLCDSPAKSPAKEPAAKLTSLPKYKCDTPDCNPKETQLGLGDKSSSPISCSTSEKDVPNSEIINHDEKDSAVKTSISSKNETSNESKNVSPQDKVIEENTFNEEVLVKDSKIQDVSSVDKEKETTHESPQNSCNKKSSIKDSTKQVSIKELVSSKSPNMNSADPPRVNQDCTSDKNDSLLTKTDSSKCVTPTRDESSISLETTLNKTDLMTPTNADESLTKDDSSTPSSECNSSSLSTPGTDPIKKISKTPRRMTPKQLLKLKEKEEKKKAKERLREENEKKKAKEKEEKLRLKKEKEDERLRLKQEKEEEKRREKEEKEKKKQAELEQKNEEKRLKEEEKRQKEEEKRIKEEERRKKEEEERKKKEEKRLREEQKEAEKRKSAQAFANFFVKTESKPAVADEDKEYTPAESIFQPFEVKSDMRLAPLVRSQLHEERRQALDSALEQGTEDQRLYLEQIRSPSYVCGSASRTFPPPDETDDEVIIVESEKTNESMETDEIETGRKSEKRHHRAKLLQFHENRRPPYWGTWRKKSKCIRPRAPLNQDKTMLEYEVDSDDEWEEPEDGESLRGSEDEESQDEQYEEDNDMFVPHGYLSDGEGEDDMDDQSPEAMKARLKLLQMEFEAERSEKQQKLKPRLIGCVWFSNSESDPSIVGSQIAELFLLRRAVWDGSLPVKVVASLPASPSTMVTSGATDTPGEEPKSGAKKKFVKESMIPDIIKKVHGSRKKLSKLLVELLDGWDKEKTDYVPSKACLAKKIREIAAWERPTGAVHQCWYVKEDVRHAYGLPDLDLPPPPPSPVAAASPSNAANITKFTKVLTTDERLKLLRESPVASKEVPKDASKTTPLTPTQNLKTPLKSSVKTPTVKLSTQSPVVKKRVPLITVDPKESPKQNASTSIMNFVTKSAKSEGSENIQKQGTVKVEEKVKKRITPITLTTSVSKPNTVTSTEDDCIILDD